MFDRSNELSAQEPCRFVISRECLESTPIQISTTERGELVLETVGLGRGRKERPSDRPSRLRPRSRDAEQAIGHSQMLPYALSQS
jgi:hypothetical protein